MIVANDFRESKMCRVIPTLPSAVHDTSRLKKKMFYNNLVPGI